MSLQQDRRRSNRQRRCSLNGSASPGLRNGHGSERFAYFSDDQRLMIVAGPRFRHLAAGTLVQGGCAAGCVPARRGHRPCVRASDAG